MIKPKKEFYIK